MEASLVVLLLKLIEASESVLPGSGGSDTVKSQPRGTAPWFWLLYQSV